jgi:hypothetical protein
MGSKNQNSRALFIGNYSRMKGDMMYFLKMKIFHAIYTTNIRKWRIFVCSRNVNIKRSIIYLESSCSSIVNTTSWMDYDPSHPNGLQTIYFAAVWASTLFTFKICWYKKKIYNLRTNLCGSCIICVMWVAYIVPTKEMLPHKTRCLLFVKYVQTQGWLDWEL